MKRITLGAGPEQFCVELGKDDALRVMAHMAQVLRTSEELELCLRGNAGDEGDEDMPFPISCRPKSGGPNVDELLGLKGHWDASALPLANNDPVTTWTGSGTASLASFGAAHATFKTNVSNGKPGILFPAAANAGYRSNAAALDLGTAWTVYTVLRMPMAPDADAMAWMWGEVAAGKRRSLWIDSEEEVNFSGNSANVTTSENIADDAPHLVTIKRAAGGTVTVYVDGVSAASGTPSLNAYTYTYFAVGANHDGTEGLESTYLHEVRAYGQTHADGDRAVIEAALMSKWGVS